MTLILSSAAEAAATRTTTPMRIRRHRMHSSFDTRKGLRWTVHAGLLALRVRTPCSTSGGDNRPSRGWPSDRLRLSSLTVARQRGILTRFPLRRLDEDARTKIVKERK